MKFRVVCGPTEAADWKYCPKNVGNKMSVKQPFQRVGFGGNLDELYMAQQRTWGLAENGFLYFGLFETQDIPQQKQTTERCPVAFFRAWLFKVAVNWGGLHRKLDSPFWAFRHNMGLLQKFVASSKLNTSAITTRRSAILWNSFSFPRLLCRIEVNEMDFTFSYWGRIDFVSILPLKPINIEAFCVTT